MKQPPNRRSSISRRHWLQEGRKRGREDRNGQGVAREDECRRRATVWVVEGRATLGYCLGRRRESDAARGATVQLSAGRASDCAAHLAREAPGAADQSREPGYCFTVFSSTDQTLLRTS